MELGCGVMCLAKTEKERERERERERDRAITPSDERMNVYCCFSLECDELLLGLGCKISHEYLNITTAVGSRGECAVHPL